MTVNRRTRILEAADQWEAEHGPLVMIDWAPRLARMLGRPERADRWEAGSWPRASEVVEVFGSWNAMQAARGRPRTHQGVWHRSPRHQRKMLEADRPGEVETGPWTRDEILAACVADRERRGRWPTETDWQAADPEGRRPTAETVKRLWGRFSAMVRDAGGRPLRPGERPEDRARRDLIGALLEVAPDLAGVEIARLTGMNPHVVRRHVRWMVAHGDLAVGLRRQGRLWRPMPQVAWGEVAERLARLGWSPAEVDRIRLRGNRT